MKKNKYSVITEKNLQEKLLKRSKRYYRDIQKLGEKSRRVKG